MKSDTKDQIQPEQCCGAREMTVAETINARIERHNREIAELISMRDNTPHNMLSQPISRFERLYVALFNDSPF